MPLQKRISKYLNGHNKEFLTPSIAEAILQRRNPVGTNHFCIAVLLNIFLLHADQIGKVFGVIQLRIGAIVR